MTPPLAPSPTGSRPALALGDLQWFALAWYGQTLDRLCRRKGLEPLRRDAISPAALARLPGAASGHLVAVSGERLDEGRPGGRAVVVGGPCLGDCGEFPTLEALYDSVQALRLGRALAAPVLLYLGDEEEAMERGGGGRWARLAGRLELWLAAIARELGAEATVVRTGSGAHRAALGRVGPVAGTLPVEEVDAAFHLASTAPRAQEERARQATRRVIEAHLPRVVGAHVGARGPEPEVVVAENLQQAGVYVLARELARRTGGEVGLHAHWPAPGLSATERMYRSGGWDKLPAWELQAVASDSIPGLHPYTRDFFAAWLPEAERTPLERTAREAWEASASGAPTPPGGRV